VTESKLTSKDKKTLIFAKVSTGDFTVPDGIEVLEEHSLHSAGKDIITIPASVREIKDCVVEWDHIIRTTSGTYAEDYAKKNKIKLIYTSIGPIKKTEDGTIYTADKKTLIRYSHKWDCDVFRVPDEVEKIDALAFKFIHRLSALLIGSNCRSIGEDAFIHTACVDWSFSDNGLKTELYGLLKYYISPSVQNIENDIFDGKWEEGVPCFAKIIVGGEIGSPIWKHCSERGIMFLEVKEEDAETFLSTPYKELVERYKNEG
jgi:hypothetical protein